MGWLVSGGGRRGGGFGPAHFFLLIIGISWLCWSGVEGLECYVCEKEGKTCENDNPRPCPSGVEFCGKLDGQRNGKKVIKKGCQLKSGVKEGCSNVDEKGFKGEACFCKTDLCNTSAKKYPPSLMILLAASTLTAVIGVKFGVLRGGI